MNVEFHYYIVHYLCNHAGFTEDESRVIAYSSQYVDNALVSRIVETDNGEYRTMITQNYGWWSDSFPRDVYLPFHFFPGDIGYEGARRNDGATNPFSTTPDSSGVKRLLIEALRTRNLYRVGIALHTYADSWAHQNFSGLYEEWNTFDRNSIIPAIGHAQAMRSPDMLSLTWQDPRIVASGGFISNRERFFQAARKIYKYLATYNRRGFDDVDFVMDRLDEILGPPGTERQMSERILDLIIAETLVKYDRYEWISDAIVSEGLFEGSSEDQVPSGYDKLTWFTDAVLYRSNLMKARPARAKPRFFASHFHRWNEAAKEHLAAANTILAEKRLS